MELRRALPGLFGVGSAVVLAAAIAVRLNSCGRGERPFPPPSDSYPLSVKYLKDLGLDNPGPNKLWRGGDVGSAFRSLEGNTDMYREMSITGIADTQGYLAAIAADANLGLARTFADLDRKEYRSDAERALRRLDETARRDFGHEGPKDFPLSLIEAGPTGQGLVLTESEEYVQEVARAAMGR